ncbi:40S ribosomal protein S10 [Trichonephila clavipes]|nr:40S ribosomal protein S10 [Trichonephila clavipes]
MHVKAMILPETNKNKKQRNFCKSIKMLMPKAHRIAVYEYLFKEGVMVAKKDLNAPKHPDIENVPNLHVIKTLQSLKSKGLVKEQFSWRHFYWYLTNEGIQYLREVLNLPPEIVPATLKRQVRPETTRQRPRGGADKRGEVGLGGAEAKLEFKGGFGRGQRPPQ